jgi:hypothetical protein
MLFVANVLQNGGRLKPIFINRNNMTGPGLTSPSVWNEDGKVHLNVRNVDYTLFNSEQNKFLLHNIGLCKVRTQLLPDQQDQGYRVNDILGRIPEEVTIMDYYHASYTYYPFEKDFINPMNFNLFKWDDTIYVGGIIYSPEHNAHLMTIKSLEKGQVSPENVFTINFCGQHWSPVHGLNKMMLRSANPVMLYEVDYENKKTTEMLSRPKIKGYRDWYLVSQVVDFNDHYVAVVQEKHLSYFETGAPNLTIRHRIVKWNKEWELIKFSPDFTFMGNGIECCSGITVTEQTVIMTFSVNDQISYILNVPHDYLQEFIDAPV